MRMDDQRFVESAPCYPLHAVDPEEQDSPWAVEPETPAETLLSWIGDVWGSPLQGFGEPKL